MRQLAAGLLEDEAAVFWAALATTGSDRYNP